MTDQAMDGLLVCAERAWRLAWALMRNADDADDVVQAAFVVAVSKPRAIPRDDPWPWFGTVVVNLARNARRSRKRRSARSIAEAAMDISDPGSRGPEGRYADVERSRALWAELDKLPSGERDALVLTKISGMPRDTAAKALDVPLTTLDYWIKCGSERLRRRCADAGLDEGRLAAWPVAMPAIGIQAAASQWLGAAQAGAVSSAAQSLASSFIASHPTLLTGMTQGGLLMKRLTIAGATVALGVSAWLGISAIYGDGGDKPSEVAPIAIAEDIAREQPPRRENKPATPPAVVTTVPVVQDRTQQDPQAIGESNQTSPAEPAKTEPGKTETTEPAESYQTLLGHVLRDRILAPAEVIPADVQAYAELKSLQASLANVESVQWLATSAEERTALVARLKGMCKEQLKQAFGLDQEQAASIVDTIERAAVAARLDYATNESKGIAIFSFASPLAIDKAITLSSFLEAGDETPCRTGRYYSVKKKGGSKGKPVCCVFRALNMIAGGHADMLAEVVDVIEKGTPPLTTNASYTAALREGDAENDIIGVLMPNTVKAKPEGDQAAEPVNPSGGGLRSPQRHNDEGFAMLQLLGLFDYENTNQKPVFAGLRITPQGDRLTIRASTSNTGLFPPEALMPVGQKIKIGGRLPYDTMGYIAVSTKVLHTPDEYGRLLAGWLADIGPDTDSEVKEAKANLAQGVEMAGMMLAQFGLSSTMLAESIGEQLAVGAVFSDTMGYIGDSPIIVGVMDVGNIASLKSVLETVKSTLVMFGAENVKDIEGGWEASVIEGDGYIENGTWKRHKGLLSVSLKGNQLYVAMSYLKECDQPSREVLATMLKGEKTLATNVAHATALQASMPQAHAFGWLDTARPLKKLLLELEESKRRRAAQGDENKEGKNLTILGFSADTLVVTQGDNRITSYASLFFDYRGSECIVTVEGWNVATPLGLFVFMTDTGAALFEVPVAATAAAEPAPVPPQPLPEKRQ